jgi:hypothetical protein
MNKVLTAPLAIIRIGGVAIGKIKNIRITESIQRGTVRGIGRLTPDELPAVAWDGSLNCGMYTIDMSKSLNVLTDAKVLQRVVQSNSEFVDTVLLQEDGLQIDIMRKVVASRDAETGVVQSELEIFASVKGCFITREGMDITESQISGRDADFVYTNPIIYPV